ncbi:MAG: polymerase subunit delta, partial [Pseudomonadota bacterium]
GRADGLPATIRSRCVAVAVPMPDPEAAAAWLCAEPGISPPDAPRLLAAAGGAPLHARELADPAKAQVHKAVLEAFAGIPGHSAMRAADAIAAIAPRDWLPILQAWVSDLGRVLGGGAPRRYPGEAARLGTVARSTSLERLSGFEAWLRRQLPATGHPVNPRLFCEDIALRYSALFGQGRTAAR